MLFRSSMHALYQHTHTAHCDQSPVLHTHTHTHTHTCCSRKEKCTERGKRGWQYLSCLGQNLPEDLYLRFHFMKYSVSASHSSCEWQRLAFRFLHSKHLALPPWPPSSPPVHPPPSSLPPALLDVSLPSLSFSSCLAQPFCSCSCCCLLPRRSPPVSPLPRPLLPAQSD